MLEHTGGQVDMWISLWMTTGVGQSNYYRMVKMRLTIKVALMIFINLSRIDVSKEWAIIDIRHPGLPNDNPEYSADSHWINVYCQKNWKSVIIEDEDGRVEIKLMGEYL
ncbi:unnamed protein product [Rhizophagus irregularis]|nr:unnamed protein product [Rhizophagus irregularis]